MRAPADDDDEMVIQFERVIRRVKRSMHYRGSYSTRDILGSLVARWLQSGEWQRLQHVPPAERRIGESVRRFILDRLQQLRRRGEGAPLADEALAIPDDAALLEMIELAELRAWIDARVTDLARGCVDPRVESPPAQIAEVGGALQRHLAGQTQRAIAVELGLSLGAVNKRIAEGTSYLIVLRGIEEGVA